MVPSEWAHLRSYLPLPGAPSLRRVGKGGAAIQSPRFGKSGTAKSGLGPRELHRGVDGTSSPRCTVPRGERSIGGSKLRRPLTWPHCFGVPVGHEPPTVAKTSRLASTQMAICSFTASFGAPESCHLQWNTLAGPLSKSFFDLPAQMAGAPAFLLGRF